MVLEARQSLKEVTNQIDHSHPQGKKKHAYVYDLCIPFIHDLVNW